MRTLTIEASDIQSARDLIAALSEFFPHWSWGEFDHCRIDVALSENPHQAAAVLSTLQTYVTEHAGEQLTRVELDGKPYPLKALLTSRE